MSDNAQITLDGVSHTYHTEAGPLPTLRDTSFSVNEGGFTAVVGPSGCGKSTLTRLIAGLIYPEKGNVLLGGEKVVSPRPTVGMAFQNPVLLEWRTVLRNVILPLEIVAPKMPTREREERACELLDLVGLIDFKDKRPSELSGGMRQRVSLCRSLAHYPEVLILDEPFAALDAFTREEIWMTLHALREIEMFTCLLITHDLREAVFLSNEVLVLSDRPATPIYHTTIQMGDNRQLADLYNPETTRLLAELRHQIEIAQGRVPKNSEETAH